MSAHGTFLWNELLTDDQAVACRFYSELFGWQRHEVDAGPLGTYTLFQHDGEDVAGMMNGRSGLRWLTPATMDRLPRSR